MRDRRGRPARRRTMYAFVRFLEDNVCYALPVSCVQDFSPTSQLDFDNQKVYTVYRNPEEAAEEDDESPGEWGERLLLHKAQILALAGGRGQGRLREGAGGGRSPGGAGGAGPGGSASDPQGCAGASAGGTAGRGGERGRVGESPPRGKKKKGKVSLPDVFIVHGVISVPPQLALPHWCVLLVSVRSLSLSDFPGWEAVGEAELCAARVWGLVVLSVSAPHFSYTWLPAYEHRFNCTSKPQAHTWAI